MMEYKKIYIMDLKKPTFNLILVLIQKTFEDPCPYNFLYLLKIIFNASMKIREF